MALWYDRVLRHRQIEVNKSDTAWDWSFNMPCKSLKGILVLFEEEKPYTRDMSKFYNPKVQKVSVIMAGKPNQLYAQGMRLLEQYDEICKYFAEGKQKNNNTNEIQEQLQLHDLSVETYLTDKYALWLDFRTIDENTLHGTGRKIENESEGITLQIVKDAESAGNLNTYIYLIMDVLLNIQNGAFVSAIHQVTKKMFMKEPHIALFVAPTGVGETHLALNLLKKEYKNYFDFIIIICPMLKHNETYRSRKWVWIDLEVTLINPGHSLYSWIEKIDNLLAGSKTLFLIDDIISDETLDKQRQPLLDFVISGRHRKHSLWLLTQSYILIPKNIRRQAKMLYVWYSKNRTDLNTIHEENDVIETTEELANVKKQLKLGKYTCLIMRMELPRAYEIG